MDLKKFLSQIKIERPFKLTATPVQITELNRDLMKKIGKEDESKALQIILDKNLSFEFCKANRKKYITAVNFVTRLSNKSY